MLILLAMIVVPITEIAVFIEAGDQFGLWPTIGAVILTAIVGSALLRHQGLSTLMRVQESMNAGRLPMAELFDGLCLLVAGALLLTPGFVTDGVGLLLFTPPFRTLLRGLLARRLAAARQAPGPGPSHGAGSAAGFDSTIIDGEFYEVDAETNKGDARQNNRSLPPQDPRQDN